MSRGRKVAIWAVVIAAVGGTAATERLLHHNTKSISVKGAVIRKDSDTKKELPVADVAITIDGGSAAPDAKSDASCFFSLTVRPGVMSGELVTLRFRYPDYQPLDVERAAGDDLYVARLVPVSRETRVKTDSPEVPVANVSIRYSIKATT